MKKAFLIGVVVGLVVFIASCADANVLKKVSDVFVSSDIKIKNVSVLIANTSYEVNFSEGAIASWNLQARGGDITVTTGGTTTEARWTIGQNAVKWDHFPMLLAKNTKLYVFAATVPATLEMFYTYY